MLTELRIRNFAIIEQVTLPLAEGFNVLSGETGAGKSIIVGALGLLLGDRASADLIRSGADRATVEGVFDVAKLKGIAALADDHGIEINHRGNDGNFCRGDGSRRLIGGGRSATGSNGRANDCRS